MTHVEPFDLEDWDRRLDAGGRSDPLLEIAASLRELAPLGEPPSPDFKARLRARLQQQHAGQTLVRRPSAWRWAGAGLALIAAVILALAGLWRWPERVPAVSAAEVLQLGSRRLAEQLATGDVIYDRLTLDWDQGGDWRRQGVVAELWRSPDGKHVRYQMLDGDQLLYFDQHDGESVWRSSYVRPVEGLPVRFVYQAPYRVRAATLDDKQLVAQLLFRDLSSFWMYVDQLAGAERTGCTELFCALSALGQGWVCVEQRCRLNLGPVLGAQDFVIEAQVTRQSRLPNGREVYEVRLDGPGSGDQFYTTLKFDTATHDLLEIEDVWHGQLHYRISLLERKALNWVDLPASFFQSVPAGVEVRPWPSAIPLGHKEDDQAWLISADPPAGSSLSGVVTATLEIGYRLTSIQEAAIEVSMSWVAHDMPYRFQDNRVLVAAGEGTIPMTFTVDTDQLGAGRWAVGAGFMDSLGIAPNTGWGGVGAPMGINVEWCLHCPPASPTP